MRVHSTSSTRRTSLRRAFHANSNARRSLLPVNPGLLSFWNWLTASAKLMVFGKASIQSMISRIFAFVIAPSWSRSFVCLPNVVRTLNRTRTIGLSIPL